MTGRILIAEDEPFIVESLTFLLSRAGHEVSAVTEGPAVMQALQNKRPDLLILDIMIPEMNGFDVLRQVRANPDMSKLGVLVLSAKGQDTDRRLMNDLGADDFVTKPFSNTDLVARVADLIAKRQGANTDADTDADNAQDTVP